MTFLGFSLSYKYFYMNIKFCVFLNLVEKKLPLYLLAILGSVFVQQWESLESASLLSYQS